MLGSIAIVPRGNSVFEQNEEIAFYYQIYGAAKDATTASPSVDLSYAFEKKVANQWKMVGGRPVVTPAQTRLVQAFSLPLTRWPKGDYRVSIEVTDKVADKTVTAELPFTITKASTKTAKKP